MNELVVEISEISGLIDRTDRAQVTLFIYANTFGHESDASSRFVFVSKEIHMRSVIRQLIY